MIITQVLVNMFTSVLSSTPSDSQGLTALAAWILGTMILVFVALLLYVVVLVNMRRGMRRTGSDIETQSLDLDPIFLVIHVLLFIIFLFTYSIVSVSK